MIEEELLTVLTMHPARSLLHYEEYFVHKRDVIAEILKGKGVVQIHIFFHRLRGIQVHEEVFHFALLNGFDEVRSEFQKLASALRSVRIQNERTGRWQREQKKKIGAASKVFGC